MTTEQITQLILQIAPSVVTIFTMIGIVAKVLSQLASLKKQVTDMKAVKEVNEKLATLIQENYELKRTLNETMTKIDHVRRETPQSRIRGK